LVFFGFGTIGSKSNEIGSSTLIAMPEEETLAINKDLLLTFYSSREGWNTILVFKFCHNGFGVKGRIDGNQRRKVQIGSKFCSKN
jgi:hypothetical protein